MSDGGSLPDRMRAVTLNGAGFHRLAVRTVPVPEPGPRQLLARVDAAGICTSLIKIVEQGSNSAKKITQNHRHPPKIVVRREGEVVLVLLG